MVDIFGSYMAGIPERVLLASRLFAGYETRGGVIWQINYRSGGYPLNTTAKTARIPGCFAPCSSHKRFPDQV